MSEMIDNKELDNVMDILENMEDEQLAVTLLQDFNNRTKELGVLITNKDSELDHAHWKTQCDDAKDQVEKIIKKIIENK